MNALLNRRTGLAAGIALALLSGAAVAQETPLQVAYSTDNYLTCESLKDEALRMDAIIASADPAVVKIARDRKALIENLFKSKACDAPKAGEDTPARNYLSQY